jgi:hypothetical protein
MAKIDIGDIVITIAFNPSPTPDEVRARAPRWYSRPRLLSPIMAFYHAALAEAREAEAMEAQCQALVEALGVDDEWALWAYENYPGLFASRVDWAAIEAFLREVEKHE